MTPLAGQTFGIVGALAAFPRRLAAREVERRGGRLRRGGGRGTGHVVLGRRLLERPDTGVLRCLEAERAAGRRLLSENAFLRLLGLAAAPGDAGIDRQALLDRSRLAPADLELLALFDAFEHPEPPFSFRDVLLGRKYAGLIVGGAGPLAIARSVHRFGPVASLTAKALHVEDGHGICVRAGETFSRLDGQLFLDLGAGGADLEALFEAAEVAEAEGRHRVAERLYRRCLDADPGDAVAAFNRANCLSALGWIDEAIHELLRATKLDPELVEARFNLAGLLVQRGEPDAARRQLRQAVARDAGYADAVFNLAKLEFEAGALDEARRCWERYLELDSGSEWARTAARGLAYVALQARGTAG